MMEYILDLAYLLAEGRRVEFEDRPFNCSFDITSWHDGLLRFELEADQWSVHFSGHCATYGLKTSFQHDIKRNNFSFKNTDVKWMIVTGNVAAMERDLTLMKMFGKF